MNLDARVAALRAEGKSFAEIALALQARPRSGPQAEILRRAALPRTFDAKIFAAALSKGLSSVSFNTFVTGRDVDLVSWVGERRGAKSAIYCLRPDVRTEALRTWHEEEPAAQQAFASALARYFHRQGDSVNAFVCRLHAAPDRARREFLRRYSLADRDFDYVQLTELLQLVRERQEVIAPALLETLGDRERYFRSRTLYADDWMRSAMFLERLSVLRVFEQLVRGTRPWVLHLHAPGGMGKTAFLRWFISRHATVEREKAHQRVPTARIDFDLLDPSALREWPWLVMIPIVEQLNVQLPSQPFESLVGRFHSFREVVFRSGQQKGEARSHLFAAVRTVAPTLAPGIFQDFASALGKTGHALIIFDTVEEMMLHQPKQFGEILEGCQIVREKCERFRLVLSGRYPLSEISEFAPLAKQLGSQLRSILLKPFRKEESERYLRQIRGLKSRNLVTRIATYARGNPFKLSLLADLAEGVDGLKDEDFRHPEIAYLLRRVIERIPEEELALRWTLRYAVIPRTLDPAFFDRALKPHLEREIAKETARRLDTTSGGLPKGFTSPWKYVEESGAVVTAQLWEGLKKYAGPRSWVVLDNGTPRLQPEVVVPMMQLLRCEEIFPELQTSAAVYFAELAAERPGEWAKWTAEECYHRIQGDYGSGIEYWRACFNRPEAESPAARQLLAEVVVNKFFIDDKGDAKIDPITRTASLKDADLGLARLTLAAAALSRAENMSKLLAISEIEDAGRQLRLLKKIERRTPNIGLDPGRRAYVEASIAHSRRLPRLVTAICKRALAAAPGTAYTAALLALMADQQADALKASALYERAEAVASPLISVAEILSRHAYMWFDAGNLRRASDLYERAYREAVAQSDTRRADAALTSLLEIADASLDTHAMEEMQTKYFQHYVEPGAHSISFGDRSRALIALLRGALLTAMTRTNVPDGDVERVIWESRDLVQRYRIDEAFERLDAWTEGLGGARPDLVERVGLEKARISLDVLGDARRARSILPDHESSDEYRLTRLLLEMRIAASLKRGPKRFWLTILRMMPSRSVRTVAHVYAQWLAYGSPTRRDWAIFAEATAQITPLGARRHLLQPMVHEGRALHSSVRGLFWDIHLPLNSVWQPKDAIPQDDLDFISHAVLLAAGLADRTRFAPVLADDHARPAHRAADTLLARAMALAPPNSIVILERILRAANRVLPPINAEFTDKVVGAIKLYAKSEPLLASVTALLLASWQSARGNDTVARNMLALATSIRGEEIAFEGRFAYLATELYRRYSLDRIQDTRRKIALPHRKPYSVYVRQVGGRRLLFEMGGRGRARKEGFLLDVGMLDLAVKPPLQVAGNAVQRWAGTPPVQQFRVLRNQEETDFSFVCGPELAALPLEGILSFPKARCVYRTPESRIEVLTRWYRDTVRPPEARAKIGPWSIEDQRELELRLRAIGVNAPLTSVEAALRLRLAARPIPTILYVSAGAEAERARSRGYGASGLDPAKYWFAESFVQITPEKLRDLEEAIADKQPDLIWLAGDFEPIGSEIAFRVVKGMARSRHSQVSESLLGAPTLVDLKPEGLARALKSLRSTYAYPMIFLDVPDDPLRGNSFVLRNRFAHALFQTGAVRAVLAAGFVAPKKLGTHLDRLSKSIRARATEGHVRQRLAPLCELPPVLYSYDATLPFV